MICMGVLQIPQIIFILAFWYIFRLNKIVTKGINRMLFYNVHAQTQKGYLGD
jgi:hypothetical protein